MTDVVRLPRLAPLYAAGFVTAFGANSIATAVGGQHEQLGLSLAWLGMFLALYDIAELILKPVFGALSDRIGPKPVIVGGLLIFAAASVFGIAATGPVALGAVRFLQGVGASAFSPASSAAVARLTPQTVRGRYFGRYGSWKGLGYAGGPIVGAGIVLLGGTGWLFGVMAALALLTALAVTGFVTPIVPLSRKRATLAALIRSLIRPGFLVPVMVLALGSAAIGALTGMLPALGTAVGLPLLVSAAAVAVLAVVSAIAQPFTGRAHDAERLPVRAACVTGALGILIAFALIAFAPGAITMFAGAALVGVGVAIVTPVAFAHLSATTPEERLGSTMGSAELGREAGDAAGPLVVGGIGTLVGFPAGFAAFALLAAAVATASALGLRTQVPHQ